LSQLLIVVAYPDGALSSTVFRAVQRARRAIERGGYAARIELVPASAAVGDLIVGHTAVDGLVERLVAEGRLQRGPTASRAVATHRGLRTLGDRARIAD
jgi:hypothetical protein